MNDARFEKINGVWLTSREATLIRARQGLSAIQKLIYPPYDAISPSKQLSGRSLFDFVKGSLVPVLPLLTGAATAMSLCLYLTLRLVYWLFYSPLGFQPEDVGFGYSQVLGQSLTVVLAYLMVSWAPFAIGYWLSSSVLRRFGYAARGLIVSLVLVTAVGLPIGNLLYLLNYLPPWFKWPVSVSIALAMISLNIGVGASVRYVRYLQVWMEQLDSAAGAFADDFPWLLPIPPRAKPPSGQRFVLTAVSTMLLLSVALGASAAVGRAVQDSARLRKGDVASGLLIAGLPITSWGGEIASLYWYDSSGNATQLLKSSCLVYLGQNSDTAAIYDVTHQTSVRVPAKSVAIIIDRGRTHC